MQEGRGSKGSGSLEDWQDSTHQIRVNSNWFELSFKDEVNVKELAIPCMLSVFLRHFLWG